MYLTNSCYFDVTNCRLNFIGICIDKMLSPTQFNIYKLSYCSYAPEVDLLMIKYRAMIYCEARSLSTRYAVVLLSLLLYLFTNTKVVHYYCILKNNNIFFLSYNIVLSNNDKFRNISNFSVYHTRF